MEEKIRKLKNEFYFYQNDISYYQALVEKNIGLPIAKLRIIIKNDLNASFQKKEYGWLIRYFDDVSYYGKKEGLIVLMKKLNTISHYNITIDLNCLEYLLNNCPNLSKFLETIFATYKNLTEKDINKMTSNENLASFLYGYAVIKNLFLIEELNESEEMEFGQGNFIDELKKIPVMPKEEQIKKFQQIVKDQKVVADPNASLAEKKQAQVRIELNKEAIIKGNLRLIIKPAAKYTTDLLPFEDLFQEGYFGLHKAVDRFSLDKNCSFSTYALWWIKENIMSYVKNNGNLIRIPVHADKKINQYRECYNKLCLELGRTPREEELAKKMEVSVEKVREYQIVINQRAPFLNIVVDSKDNTESDQSTLESLIPSDEDIFEEVSDSFLKEKVNEILANQLNLREEYVIRMRLGIPCIDSNLDRKEYHTMHTLEEISNILNLTKEGVRQIEVKALKKLRKPRILKYLESYSDVVINEENYWPFWQNFKGINTEKVILAISSLSQEDQDILHKLYGSDLNDKNITLTPYEYQKRGELIRKIKLNIPNFKTFIKDNKQIKMYLIDFLHCSWEQLSYLTEYLDATKPIYEILIKLFGPNFKDANHILNLGIEEQNIFNEWLQDMNIILRLNKFSNKTFEQFFGCSNEKKNIFLNNINKENPKYRLIFILWGEDLNKRLNNYLASDLIEEFISLYKEIKRELSITKLSQTNRKIYNVLNTSQTQMKKIYSIIINSQQYKDLFVKIYGENLNGEENLDNLSKEELTIYYNCLPEIETILKNRSNRKIWTVLGISIGRFRELKDLIFNNPNYKEIFQKVYDIDLLGKQNIESLSKEEEHLYWIYLEEIKAYLRNSIDKKLYKILGTTARNMDKLRRVILNSQRYKDLFVKIYGNELANGENLESLSEVEVKQYYEYLKEIKYHFLNGDYENKENDYEKDRLILNVGDYYTKIKRILEERVKYYLAEKEQISKNNKELLEDLLWQDFLIPNNYEEYIKLEHEALDRVFTNLIELLPIECRLFTCLRLGMNPDRQIYSIAQIAQINNLPIDYITKMVHQGLAYLNIMCTDYERIYNYHFFSQDITLKRKKEELKED